MKVLGEVLPRGEEVVMHFFAVFLGLSFGVMALVMLGERGYRRLGEARAALGAGLGVGLAWLANFDMWTGWGIGNLRYGWVGVTLTGVALGGSALVLHALVGFLNGLHRKHEDQAEQIERTQLRRIA